MKIKGEKKKLKLNKDTVLSFRRGDVFYLELSHVYEDHKKIEFKGNVVVDDFGDAGIKVKAAKRILPCLFFDNYEKTWEAQKPVIGYKEKA